MENLTEQPLLEGTGELENLTVCALLKVPARTRSDGISMKFECFSKAARGRPEGPTERSVFKIIFVMWANFDRIGQQKNGQKTETNRWQ